MLSRQENWVTHFHCYQKHQRVMPFRRKEWKLLPTRMYLLLLSVIHESRIMRFQDIQSQIIHLERLIEKLLEEKLHVAWYRWDGRRHRMFKTVDITCGHDGELKICCAADLRATSLEEGKIPEVCLQEKYWRLMWPRRSLCYWKVWEELAIGAKKTKEVKKQCND